MKPEMTQAGSVQRPGPAGPRCRLCGKHVSEVRCYFQRVNAKGVVPALWECHPSCGATMSNGEAILAAIESPNAQSSATTGSAGREPLEKPLTSQEVGSSY